MAEINLLPGGLAAKSTLNKTLKGLKILDVFGTIAFGVCLLLLGGILLINTQKLSASRDNVEKFKSGLKGIQSSEQQYYLVKGRVDSINEIYSGSNIFKDITDLKSLYPVISEKGDISTLGLGPAKAEVAVNFNSSLKLKELFMRLSEMNYTKITVDSLSFNEKTGYQAQIKFEK